MAGKHLLQGLIKWSMRDQWADRFEQVLEDHIGPTCDEAGLEIDEIAPIIGEDQFMSTVWACAFEDFLTREFDDGANAVDDYLKRRGYKETASIRAYMAALRNSTMSLYEVSDIVRDTSFRARDLIRGGEPVLISERAATRSLKPWDRLAARVVQVGSRTQICGGILVFDHETAEALLEGWRGYGSLSEDEKRKLAKDAIGDDIDDEMMAALSPTETLRRSSAIFTTFWLTDLIDRVQDPSLPELHNAEGHELVLCEVRYPIARGTTADDVRAVLKARPEFRPSDMTSWNWLSPEKPSRDAGEPSQRSLTFETWHEDGRLVLGNVHLEDRALVLAVNSVERSEIGRALLSEMLGGRIGKPSVKTESIEQIMESREAAMPHKLDISEDERCAIIHDQLDRHYRDALDQPVPMLGGETPRAAVKTNSGRIKVVDWIKILENRTAKSGESDSPMASYSFGWMWTELGIGDLRR